MKEEKVNSPKTAGFLVNSLPTVCMSEKLLIYLLIMLSFSLTVDLVKEVMSRILFQTDLKETYSQKPFFLRPW